MNIYLLQMIGKWLSLLVVTCTSLISPGILDKKVVNVSNTNKNKNLMVINKVVNHDTKITYNQSRPFNTKKVIKPGVDGIVFVDALGQATKVIQPMISEEIELGTGDVGEYIGKLSGYGPDCPGCSKTGNVACHTKNGGKHSLISNGDKYNDSEYGLVRIVAAARAKFPCGTIVEITKQGHDPYLAVVLDSGGSMVKAFNETGTIWMDLAYTSQAAASNGNTSGNNIAFSVKRWGF